MPFWKYILLFFLENVKSLCMNNCKVSVVMICNCCICKISIQYCKMRTLATEVSLKVIKLYCPPRLVLCITCVDRFLFELSKVTENPSHLWIALTESDSHCKPKSGSLQFLFTVSLGLSGANSTFFCLFKFIS